VKPAGPCVIGEVEGRAPVMRRQWSGRGDSGRGSRVGERGDGGRVGDDGGRRVSGGASTVKIFKWRLFTLRGERGKENYHYKKN
jgi:hypothetical protein